MARGLSLSGSIRAIPRDDNRGFFVKINASIAANFFLKKAKEASKELTIMKLVKLVFLAHGWSLAILDQEDGVLDGEEVEAWKFGPVIRSLYEEFKHYGDNSIMDWSQTTIGESEDGFKTRAVFIEEEDLDYKIQYLDVLEFVWESYKEYSAWGLSHKTHEEGSPWYQVYNPELGRAHISKKIIKDYYVDCLEKMSKNV